MKVTLIYYFLLSPNGKYQTLPWIWQDNIPFISHLDYSSLLAGLPKFCSCPLSINLSQSRKSDLISKSSNKIHCLKLISNSLTLASKLCMIWLLLTFPTYTHLPQTARTPYRYLTKCHGTQKMQVACPSTQAAHALGMEARHVHKYWENKCEVMCLTAYKLKRKVRLFLWLPRKLGRRGHFWRTRLNRKWKIRIFKQREKFRRAKMWMDEMYLRSINPTGKKCWWGKHRVLPYL